MTALVGRALAEAAHPIARNADRGQTELPIGDFEAVVAAAGVEIAGKAPRQTLGSAINPAQDLYDWVEGGRWRRIEPKVPKGPGLSGQALADEAYRVATIHDRDRAGLHCETLKRLLIDEGVIIKGANGGHTLFSALNNAEHWFEWVSSGTFRWK